MMDRFDLLLQDLGQILGAPLQTDRHSMCAVRVKNRFNIQLQIDEPQENLLIVAKIGELPAGKFREETLRSALLANNLPDPRVGTFCYLSMQNSLLLYQRYPVDLVTAEKLASFLIPFIDLADKWNDAITAGQLARLSV